MEPLINKQAYREHQILEKIEVGVSLTGQEVKSIKTGRLIFTGSYVKPIGNELYWINAEIPLYKYAQSDDYDPRRSRKLLLHKAQLVRLTTKVKERPGLTIIPLKCYNKGGLLKLEIALSKGRKAHEVKSVEKERAVKRDDKRMTKEFLKS